MADKIVSWGGYDSKGTSGMGVTGSLQVSGSGRFTDGLVSSILTSLQNVNNYISLAGGGGSFIDFRANDTPIVRISSGGMFIGSDTSPSARLHIKGSGTTSSTTSLLVQNANATPSLLALDNGYVGIGKSPSASLHVYTPGTNTDLKIVALFEGYVWPAQPEVKIGIGGDGSNQYGSWFGHNVKPSSEGNFGFVETYQGVRTLTWNPAGHVAIGTVRGNYSPNIFKIAPKAFDGNTNWDTSGIMFCVQSGSVQVIAPDSASHAAMSGFGINTLNSVVYTRTFADASTIYIDGAPRAGNNLSITNPWALYINSGSSKFGGNVEITDGLTVTGSITSTGYIQPQYIASSASVVVMKNINGAEYVTDMSTGGTGDLRFYYGGGGGWSYNWYTDNTHRVRISDGGMGINIGNTNPSARLHVKGSGTTSSTTSLLVQNSSAQTALQVKDDNTTQLYNTLKLVGTSGYSSNILEIFTNGGSNPLSTYVDQYGRWYISNGNTNPSAAFIGSGVLTLGQNSASAAIQFSNTNNVLGQWSGTAGTYNNISTSETIFVVNNQATPNLYGMTIAGDQTAGQVQSKNLLTLSHWSNSGVQTFSNFSTAQSYTLINVNIAVTPTQPNKTLRGFYYNPTLSGTALLENIAFQSTSGTVHINTATPDASAALQADSTTQGFLPPRMTTAEKTAIASPAAGLMVYDTSLNQMSYYNGSTWVNF